MANDWNPRRVLAVDPSSVAVNQCVGTTLQGLRCKNPVSWKVNDDLAQAGRILDALPDVRWCQSHTAAVLRDLKRIAYFTLCRHRHRHDQAQVDNIANKWLEKIRRLQTRPAHADSRSTSRASSTSTIPSRCSTSSHTLVSRSQSMPSPPSTPSASYTSHDTRRYKNGNMDITNIVAIHSSLSRRNPSITIRNIIMDSPISAQGSSGSTSRTLSSSSSSGSSRRSPSIPLTISETDTSDADTPDTSSDNSSDDGSSEEEEEEEEEEDDDDDDGDDDDDDDDDGTIINLHVQKQRLERMLAELEAQIRESRRSSGASTPTTTTARSSHRRSNAPSLSSNRTDTSSSSRTERPYVRVKDGVVQRRPVISDTTCYICLESIKSEREATWCRSSCGKNVHHDCFNEWEDTQGDVVRCAFCRSRWTIYVTFLIEISSFLHWA